MESLLLELDQCQAKHDETFDNITRELNALLTEIRNTKKLVEEDESVPWEQHVVKLGATATAMNSMPKITKEHRLYFSAYTKLGKKIATAFPDDFDMATASDNALPSVFGTNGGGLRDAGPAAEPMVAFIGQHLVCTESSPSRPDLYAIFTEECEAEFRRCGACAPQIHDDYKDLRTVVHALEQRDPDPALCWFGERATVTPQPTDDSTQRLVLELHSLKFIKMLQEDGPVQALMYGRQHLEPFVKEYRQEVATLFAATSMPLLETGPYKHLLDANRWVSVIEKVHKVYCKEHVAAAPSTLEAPCSLQPATVAVAEQSVDSVPDSNANSAKSPTSAYFAPNPATAMPSSPPPLPPFPVVLDTPRQRVYHPLRAVPFPHRRRATVVPFPHRSRAAPFPRHGLPRPSQVYTRLPGRAPVFRVVHAWGPERRAPSATPMDEDSSWVPDVADTWGLPEPLLAREESDIEKRGAKRSKREGGGAKRTKRERKRQIGIPRYSLLAVTLTAGYTALPKILNYFNVLHTVDPRMHTSASTTSENTLHTLGGNKKVLPVEIDLSACFAFHTSFTCAVTLTQTSRFNPPYLLQCGHVISKACMDRLSNTSRGRHFKCPMCRGHQTNTRVRRLCL